VMEFMTQKEAAAFLKICRQTMARLNAPSHPVPGTNRRRYLKADLLAWMEAPQVTTEPFELRYRTKLA
jgi:hypothetical protein